MSIARFFFIVAASLLAGRAAMAQADTAPDIKNLPPKAAPTTKITVGAIPVVLSRSEVADNYVSGLIEGLIIGAKVRGAEFLAVDQDHVSIRRAYGDGPGADGRIGLGGLSDVFVAIAIMQLVEEKKIALAADVGALLGEARPRGFTLQQLLTYQAGRPAVLAELVEKTSGEPIAAYVSQHVIRPLGMTATVFGARGATSTASDMSRLMIALLNGGAYEGARVLEPQIVELMTRTSVLRPADIGGMTYGFAEMRRDGWRALQHDGETGESSVRLVLVPEAKVGYFVAARDADGGVFWSAVDNALFDHLLIRRSNALAPGDPPAPTVAQARAVAGTYEAAGGGVANLAFLKTEGLRLRVEAADGGRLVLSGAQEAVLLPRQGGYWSDAGANVTAVADRGRLLTSGGDFAPLALWKRPLFYLALALLAAVLGAAADYALPGRRTASGIFRSPVILGAGGAALLLAVVSALFWLLAPAA